MSRKRSKTLAENLQDIAYYYFLATVKGQLFSALFHTLKHLTTIQQNIDLSQCATLKNVDFWQKPLKFWFQVNVRPQRH